MPLIKGLNYDLTTGGLTRKLYLCLTFYLIVLDLYIYYPNFLFLLLVFFFVLKSLKNFPFVCVFAITQK